MKARNKVTGEVVSNFGWSKEYGTISYIGADGLLHNYSGRAEDWEILDESETDWAAYRREAAKDILCAIIYRGILANEAYLMGYVNAAVEYADALIAKLKEK